jgi:hypothetical protein
MGKSGKCIRFRSKITRCLWTPFHPLKKDIFLTVEMLIRMQNISSMFMDPAGHFCHNPRLIGTV